MKCEKCQERCQCVDSRTALTYGGVEDVVADREPIRERKYVCRKCELAYLTQEYVVRRYSTGGARRAAEQNPFVPLPEEDKK